MNFIILSNQQYDFELKTNKWHIANQLAKKGHKVVYIDPPLRFRALKSNFKNGGFNIGKLFFGLDRKNDNLIVYKPANYFNFWPFSVINTYIHTKKINSITKAHFNNDVTILYIYHFDYPDLENFIKKISFDEMVYDCVDEYTAFPEYSEHKSIHTGIISVIQNIDNKLKVKLNQHNLFGKDWVLYREKWLCKNATYVIASAPGLVDKLSKWKTPIHYLPNAADAELFDLVRAEQKVPQDIKDIAHPIIGFSGAIDTYKNNIPLIEKCAETYPDYNFVLIGPEKVSDPDLDLSRLKAFKNVYFLGKKPWEETPLYFVQFDAYFIPYNLNEYTIIGCFPIKYFEGLAAGLPTIVTNMPAYKGFDIDGYVSKTDAEFITNLKRALDENTPEKIKARKLLASQNTWSGKVDKIINIINGK